MGTVCCCPGKKRANNQTADDGAGQNQAPRPQQADEANSVRRSNEAATEVSRSSVSSTSVTEKNTSLVRWLGNVQKQEDAKRESMLFEHTNTQYPPPPTHTTTSHILARKTAPHSVLCCASCGNRLARSDTCTYSKKGTVRFDDFESAVVVGYSGFGGVSKLEKQGTPLAQVKSCIADNLSSLECKRCKLFLGVALDTTAYFCLRYVTCVNPVTDNPIAPRTLLHCVECSAVLSSTDQILCTHRRWSFCAAPSQPACYVNSIMEGNVSLAAPREERLAQGKFLMADVSCRCGKLVGYKFCKDLTRDTRNQYQIGRYGLVASCFRVAGDSPN
eukprot:TRINITY_DN4528_c0_g1_i4.p1 TRINITY_DN4528_c0_g1~~TRINITY_DN4528_c0_g1_i4.p1  ORF type:complete len:331 (+),score=39.55 TRINITY_DN4528_c0_g1_i4:105-1097(+)